MISVIIPVYKVEKYIRKCIDSIINQDYRDFELIIIDDGSPDQSIVIAEQLLRQQSDINYRIIHTQNRGVSSARNIGIKESRGDYCIMVDSDDYLSNNFLSTYARLINNNPGLNIYSTGFNVIVENEKPSFVSTNYIIQKVPSLYVQKLFLSRKLVLLLPTLLLNREFLLSNNLSFDEEVRYSEDVQFIWRCICYNEKSLVHCDAQNYNYVFHTGSTMSASNVKKIASGFEGLSKLFCEIKNKLDVYLVDVFYSYYCFNLIHGSSHMLKYSDYIILCRRYNIKKHYKILLVGSKFINIRIRIISLLGIIQPYLAYRILRKF